MRISPRTPRGPEIVRPRRSSSRSRSRSRSSLDWNRVRPVLQELEIRCLLSGPDPYQPTADEQYMLALINRARANPAAEGQRLLAIAQSDPVIEAATRNWNLNQFVQAISSYGPEPPLAFNTGLIEAARDHDAAMLAANNQFHSPTGYLNNPEVATASDGQAYFPTGTYGWATGENIFAYSSNLPAGSSAQSYVDYFDEAFFLDWGNPDFGHLKNLLAPGPAEATPGTYPFSEIGIGLLSEVTPTTAPDPSNPIAANRGLNVGPDLVTQEFGWSSGNAFLTGVVYLDNANSHFYAPGEGLGSVTIQAVGQEGQGTFQSQTWDSGGYSLQLPPGTYNIEASGNLPAPQSTTITIGQDNVPWDVPLATPGGNGNGTGNAPASAPAITPLAVAPSAQNNGTANTNTSASTNVSIQSQHVGKKTSHLIHPRGPHSLKAPVHGHSHHAIHAAIIGNAPRRPARGQAVRPGWA